MTVVKIAIAFLVLLSCSVLTEQVLSNLVKGQSKPGSCPKPLPGAPCGKLCSKDSECPNIEKCCSTRCAGQACFKSGLAEWVPQSGQH